VLDLVGPSVDRMLDRVEQSEPPPTLNVTSGSDASVQIGEGQ
jgi:hypothetical protein